MKNVFYFNSILEIGGIESYLYYLAKKYQDWDITIYYKQGNPNQISRLSKFVRVKRYQDGEIIKCDKVFFNFNLEIIDNVIAKEYSLILHGDYKDMIARKQIYEAPKHPKINKYYGVTQLVCDNFKEVTGIDVELLYNPITIEEPKKAFRLISATRLSLEKGFDRMKELIKRLDERKIPYTWDIYTNSPQQKISDNIVYRKPRLDILNYVKASDFLIQLSDNEGYCYSVIESLSIGIPVIVTPCPAFKELGLNDANSITFNFDCSNVDQVIDRMLEKFEFEYKPKKDNWENVLEKGKSTYKEELKMRYLVEATEEYEKNGITDNQRGNVIPKAGEQWEVDFERKEILTGGNEYGIVFVKVIKEIEDEIKEVKKEEIKTEDKEDSKKAKRKTKKA